MDVTRCTSGSPSDSSKTHTRKLTPSSSMAAKQASSPARIVMSDLSPKTALTLTNKCRTGWEGVAKALGGVARGRSGIAGGGGAAIFTNGCASAEGSPAGGGRGALGVAWKAWVRQRGKVGEGRMLHPVAKLRRSRGCAGSSERLDRRCRPNLVEE